MVCNGLLLTGLVSAVLELGGSEPRLEERTRDLCFAVELNRLNHTIQIKVDYKSHIQTNFTKIWPLLGFLL